MLLFKKIFHDAIAAGTKTTTLRYWTHRRVKPGSVHLVPRLGHVRICDVEIVQPGDLTDRDALADGFDSLGSLRRALDEMYPPEQRAGRALYKITFSYMGNA